MLIAMEWLNYHHLLYFWMVVREGGLAKAAAKLRLSHPTVSGQVRALEAELGEKLFQKQGRRLVLTEMGRVVYDYADEIFGLGRELLDTIRGRPSGRPVRLVVGIAEVVPKLIAKELLAPARQLSSAVRVICREDKSERLVAELATHNLDVVLSDAPIPPGSNVKAFNHLLGECGVSVFGTRALAAKYKKGFPRSLHEAPMLLPTDAASVRRSLDMWFDSHGVRPDIQGEFDDSALMEVFGQDGAGLFPASTPLEATVRRQFDVELLGRLPEVRERFYAISVERRIKHPAVVAISQTAREQLFRVAN